MWASPLAIFPVVVVVAASVIYATEMITVVAFASVAFASTAAFVAGSFTPAFAATTFFTVATCVSAVSAASASVVAASAGHSVWTGRRGCNLRSPPYNLFLSTGDHARLFLLQ